MSSISEFNWPPQYSFPPFFTIQPNAETRQRQLKIWSQLILDYSRQARIFILDKTNNSIELFNNKQISRQLTQQSLDAILDDMAKKELIEWVDAKKERCFIYWHSPIEWSSMIYKYVQSNGLVNTVETYYELLKQPSSKAEFSGMDSLLFRRCLKVLEEQGKAECIGDDGVKFF